MRPSPSVEPHALAVDRPTGPSGGWATNQLAEFVTAISGLRGHDATVRDALERSAEALEAEAAAAVGPEAVLASFGFGRSAVPEQAIREAADSAAGVLDLDQHPCFTAVAPVGVGGVDSLLLARRDDRFGPEEINFLRAAGKILAQTLMTLETMEAERSQRRISEERRRENDRLLAALTERQLLLERLSTIQSSIVNRMEIGETLEAIVAGAAKLMGDEVVVLWRCGEDAPKETRVVASRGLESIELDADTVGRVGVGIAGQAIAENRLIAREHYPEADGSVSGWVEAGIRSAMAAPVTEGDHAIGSLVVSTRRRSRHYSEAERETLTAFAKHVSLALTDARAVEEAVHQGLHDALTGLPNRALLSDRLDHAVGRAARSDGRIAVLFLDLDGFKNVNDSLGHAAGDEMLAAVAERLGTSLRQGDTAARFGGDEFAILVEDADGVDLGAMAERLLACFDSPFAVQGQELFTSCSIGIATGSDADRDFLRDADLAMYEAKAAGPGSYAVFEQGMHTSVSRRLALAGDLKRAIRDHSLEVAYQPIYDLRSGQIRAVEALVRWIHPTRGPLAPPEFIPIAEETGMIVDLGACVLSKAIEDLGGWRSRLGEAAGIDLNVNVSIQQLERPGLIELIKSLLDDARIQPQQLVLELTESMLARDGDSVAGALGDLTALGTAIAVDDFGTGYSSLAQLEKFPVSILKIPKQFTDGVEGPKPEASLARATIEIGSSLDLEIIAEGIESASQVRRLVEFGCQCGQGFHLARPMQAADFERLLAALIPPTP